MNIDNIYELVGILGMVTPRNTREKGWVLGIITALVVPAMIVAVSYGKIMERMDANSRHLIAMQSTITSLNASSIGNDYLLKNYGSRITVLENKGKK